MRIDWDVPIQTRDGLSLMADVFRPDRPGRFPIIMTYGPYGKGLAFQEGYRTCWERMAADHPDVVQDSSNLNQNWEVVDPEKWVPHDYVCIRVDSRGAGMSPGYVQLWSPQEALDFYDCIEWAGVQEWSNGKVGLNGISYYAMNQWQVASLQPPHLAAICPWEGAADMYRDLSHHGGILCDFIKNWYDMQIRTVQHGLADRGPKSQVTGRYVCGDVPIPDDQLVKNREDFAAAALKHKLDDGYWRARMPDWSKVTVPIFSAANWGGQGLHPRGNFEGFTQAASKDKWLEVHGIEHWTHFYTDYGRKLQLKFFDYFLHGKRNGWNRQPKVLLNIRHPGEKFVLRAEDQWPVKKTRWTKLYLQPDAALLSFKPPQSSAKISYRGLSSDGVTFMLPPQPKDMEVTGPSALKLFLSSDTADADVFAVLRVFTPDLKEVVFQGALDPHTPVGQGWLRASHRKLDPRLTKPYRPYHTHDEKLPLKPGQIVELDVEIIPTSIVVPAGYRLALTLRGKDYVYPGPAGALSNMKYPMTGCGPFTHTDPKDRPAKVFDGTNTLHIKPSKAPYLMIPVIPTEKH